MHVITYGKNIKLIGKFEFFAFGSINAY